MRLSIRLVWCFVWALIPLSCASAIREGLPSESPLHETVVPEAGAFPQGIAIGDVGPTSALLWVRTDGPALVQAEWATPSMWKTVSKMGTVSAPVPRTPQEEGYDNLGLASITNTLFEVRVVDDAGDTRFCYHLTAR